MYKDATMPLNTTAFGLFQQLSEKQDMMIMETTTQLESITAKEAVTQYPVHEFIRQRWSARSFSDRPIEHDTLMTLLEAASWTPSSMNEQPWVFLYAHKGEPAFQQMFDCLLPGNRWADGAQVLLLSLARTNFVSNGQANRHALHDTGAANMALLLQAASMDIFGHQMGGFNMQKTIETFQIPNDLEPVCFISLGYLDDPEKLEEPFRSRELTPRKRKALSEFAYAGKLI
jgi:nitroreductase